MNARIISPTQIKEHVYKKYLEELGKDYEKVLDSLIKFLGDELWKNNSLDRFLQGLSVYINIAKFIEIIPNEKRELFINLLRWNLTMLSEESWPYCAVFYAEDLPETEWEVNFHL